MNAGGLFWFTALLTAIAGVCWLWVAIQMRARDSDPRGAGGLALAAYYARRRALMWTALASVGWAAWFIWWLV